MQNLNNITEIIKNFSFLIDKEFLVWPECAFIQNENIELVEKWNLKPYLKERKNFFCDVPPPITKKHDEVYENLNIESNSHYHAIVNDLEKIYENCKINKKIYYQDIVPIANKVISFYDKYKNSFIKYLKIKMPSTINENYHIVHSVNSAILTVALGKEMGLNGNKTLELCSVALLHKIGFLFIPIEINKKRKTLTKEEYEITKKYPLFSYRIASATNFSKSICLTLLNHKENLDGTGYPKGLKRENISIESNLIGAASAYSDIILDRTYEKYFCNDSKTSIIELIQDSEKKFDKRVLKLIINVLSSECSINCIVELNDNSIAKIVEVDKLNPNLSYVHYIIKNGIVVEEIKQQNVKSIPNTDTGIKKILNKNEIGIIKERYSLVQI